MKVTTEQVLVGLNGGTVDQIRVTGWQSDYQKYLQGFSNAHVEQYFAGGHNYRNKHDKRNQH